jgi:hypothetical protein
LLAEKKKETRGRGGNVDGPKKRRRGCLGSRWLIMDPNADIEQRTQPHPNEKHEYKYDALEGKHKLKADLVKY